MKVLTRVIDIKKVNIKQFRLMRLLFEQAGNGLHWAFGHSFVVDVQGLKVKSEWKALIMVMTLIYFADGRMMKGIASYVINGFILLRG